MATSIDQKNFVKTALRLPPELHAAVHESAQKSGRSYNAELVELIRKGLADSDRAAEVRLSKLTLKLARAEILLRDREARVADLESKVQEFRDLGGFGREPQRKALTDLAVAQAQAMEARQYLARVSAELASVEIGSLLEEDS